MTRLLDVLRGRATALLSVMLRSSAYVWRPALTVSAGVQTIYDEVARGMTRVLNVPRGQATAMLSALLCAALLVSACVWCPALTVGAGAQNTYDEVARGA